MNRIKMNKKIFSFLTVIVAPTAGWLYAHNQQSAKEFPTAQEDLIRIKSENKMKIEIWSDVMCPFCYIGKAKFDTALQDFADKNNVEIEWKSFQVMPDLQTQPGRSIHDILVEKKRISLAEAKQLNGYATRMGKEVGLTYNFDKAIPANTLRAHQFQHFAKANGKGIEAEEVMFKAYFTDGKNIDDINTLLDLGKTIGLNADALKKALDGQTYLPEVQADFREAQQIGVTGVPFFVFNRKYAVSGAQDPKSFLDVLEKSFAEWRKDHPETKLEIIEGASCKPDGTCE
ncbi:DsbA family oxidoreductase [Flavobacterium inviolabile]|uniref:DsbA family oxidoreductase n=1 Tax=Flavobacterium inviolabile TaxID=2748320 RepID=UPI001FE65AEF|nr:DsbA family oxidoreductase [Flavobacterium inviolabile]